MAIALIAAATLAYEILLVRVFAIEHFHHFAYMAIGVAMLGTGAAGTLLALAPPADDATSARRLPRAAAVTALALVASPALVHLIALDPTRLVWDAGQWVRLAAVYLLLAAPFATGGLVILGALSRERARPGRLYGASFIGSGLGAALAVASLWVLTPAGALALAAPLAALGALVFQRSALTILAAAVAVAAVVRPPWHLQVTPYKGLPQVEAWPDARRVVERTSPLGWVVAVEAPAFRHAPGLSLAYDGSFPRQTALFLDGALTGAVSDWSGDAGAGQVLRWLPTAIPYALGGRDRVLVLGAGGGTEVSSAAVHGARRVVALELSPDLVRLAHAAPLPRDAGGPEVRWIAADARSWLERSPERFDLITLGPSGGLGTTAAGVHALNEDFLHTVEAYTGYLRHLGPSGVLAVTGWLTIPPREAVRTILTAGAALHRLDAQAARRGLVVARSWGTVTVLVKPGGFGGGELLALQDWARERRLDLDWYPGLDRPMSTFNLIAEPDLFRAAEAAAAGPGEASAFASRYPFAVAPVTDARPYPHHFLRPGALGTFLRTARGSWLPFAEWGYVALLATLVQGGVVAALLLLLPAAVRARRPAGLARLVGYFMALGLGYLAAEIAVIQVLGLLLGHPVYAVAAALIAFLLCSGVGSLWSDRLGPGHGRSVLAGIVATLALFAAILLFLAHAALAAPLGLRLGLAVLTLVPLATLLGMPFPLGLRALAAGERSRVAWAWAANGFASVVAAPLAALTALELGSGAVLAVAALAYALGWSWYGRPRAEDRRPST